MKNIILSIISFILISVQLNGQTDYEKAVEHFNNREFEKAIPLFKDYLKTIDDLEAVIDVEEYIAASYYYKEDFSNSLNFIDKILLKNKINRSALIMKLKIGVSKNDFDLIFAASNNLIEDAKLIDSEVFFYRGISKMSFGDYNSAFNDLTKAYETDKNSNKLIYNLGLVNLKLEKFDDAIKFFEKSIEYNYRLEESFYNIMVCFYSLKDYESSLKIAKVIESDILHIVIQDNLETEFYYLFAESFYNLGQYRKAIPYLEQITDKTYENYARATIITVSSYENLEEEYTKRGALDKAAYFAAKRAERVFNEGYLEDGLETIDRAISLDSSLHYLLFKSQATIFKIIYYIQEDVFESKEEAMVFGRKALALTHKVYGDILALDPENELYLNRYIEDLYFFDELFDEPEIIAEICETFEKIVSLGYGFDEKARNGICNNSDEDYAFDYNIMLYKLDSFEERFGVKLEDDVE